uniref:Serine decarboxylase n=1 Tax=Oryza rufipogon TaxID=4529 RepID=A0A0E0R8A8_ORYRU
MEASKISCLQVDEQLDSVQFSLTNVVERYVIDEPPEDAQAVLKRQHGIDNLLGHFRQHLQERSAHHLGHPLSQKLDVGPLAQFQHFHINNIGDPFVESNYGIHSRQFEYAVLDWFAHLWEIPKDQYWGYVTNGGSEGNYDGLLVGRELYPEGIIYASQDSHYSIFKAAKMYRVQCIKIDTSFSGEMRYDHFRTKLLENARRPAIVNVNIGTTVKGAIDDLDEIISTLENCGFRDRFYIHCDGALAGLMLPFIKQAPKVTFIKPIGSISVSGHKLLGCPTPCGVVINRLKDIDVLKSTNIEYIASNDVTISGSRNGQSPIFLWYKLKSMGYEGIRREIEACLRNACYLTVRLRNVTISGSRNGQSPIFLWYKLKSMGYEGIQREIEACLRNACYLTVRLRNVGINAFMNSKSIIVIFEKPKDEMFMQKWQLACAGNVAHVVVMPHVSFEMLGIFVEELAEKRYALLQNKEFSVPCVAMDIGQENCLCKLHENIRSSL